MSRKVISIIKREFWQRAKTKGFIISTLLFPLIFVLLGAGVFIFNLLIESEQHIYIVVDRTGQIFERFNGMLSDTLDSGERMYLFEEQKVSEEELENKMEEFRTKVLNKEIDGYIIIPEDILTSIDVKYAARSVSNFEEQSRIRNVLSNITNNMRIKANLGLSPDEVRSQFRGVRLITPQITSKGEVNKSARSSFVLTYIMTYMLLLMILIYGQTVSRSVIEEKTQRITETIVSSVKPLELMLGKIIGICALGVTQLIVFGVFLYFMLTYAVPLFEQFGLGNIDFLNVLNEIVITPIMLVFFIIYFIMGFILYASFFAGIGAIMNTEDEAQQFGFMVIATLIVQFLMIVSVSQNPDTSASFWLSIIPLFTPLLMFIRVSVMAPRIPDGAYLSIFLLLVTVVLNIMLIAKIYRVGILMYGKRPSFKELVKWIKSS